VGIITHYTTIYATIHEIYRFLTKDGIMSYIRKRVKNGKTYLEEVESVRIDGKVVQKHIKYLGKEADKKTRLNTSLDDIAIDEVKLYGPLMVLNYLSEQIGLSELLGKHGDEILSLVFAHCINYKSLNHMTRWFERTDLNMILTLDNLTEDRLLNALDSIEDPDKVEKIQRSIFNKVKKIYKLEDSGVVYDVTNTYFCGKKCTLGKYGHDKGGVKGRPLIQIGLGVTKKDGIPIFHKTFNGNIADSRTLRDLITYIHTYNEKFNLMIFDRGITSAANILELKKLNIDSICGIASNNKLKNKARVLIAKKNIVDIKYRVKINKTVFYAFPTTYTLGKIKGTLLICYNKQKGEESREARYDEVQNAYSLLKEGRIIKPSLEKYFKNGNLNRTALAAAEELDGFTFLFSTIKMPTSDIIRLYFSDKDVIEKAFQSLKGVVNIRPIRHWLYNRVKAHVFICYLSYLLLSLLKFKLKKIKMSPVQALSELDTLYKVYIRDKKSGFIGSKTVALTKTQEIVVKSVCKKLFSKL
jgi:transposase